MLPGERESRNTCSCLRRFEDANLPKPYWSKAQYLFFGYRPELPVSRCQVREFSSEVGHSFA
jgi:hypothetical protein